MESNILIIVEGLKTEPNFFKRLSDVFGLKFDIYCLETNIYSLYILQCDHPNKFILDGNFT